MWNSEEFYEKLLAGWERSETNTGVSYYVNHSTEKTQWDHPLFVKTLEELVDMDNIRYAAYRTAMKLRFLQKRLSLDLVELGTLTTVFERHGYSGQDPTMIDAPSLARVLLDLFSLTKKRSSANVAKMNTETIAELAVNWLLNLFDVNRRGSLRVVAVKVALTALCSARLTEKYRYFFHQLKDRTNHVPEKKLGVFLRDIMQIPELVTEAGAFGGLNVGPAVNSCFAQAWSTAGITEDELINWLLKEPQTVVWLPTMHRMAAAESVKHECKCSICKAYPIIGFRYRCLKCFNYDLCQQCFFSGRCSKKHKLKHPTQEYCLATDTKEDTKAFMRTVRNNLSKKHRNKKKLCYLPVEGTDQPYMPCAYRSVEDPNKKDTHTLLSQAANQLAELEPPDHPPVLSNKSLQTDTVDNLKEIPEDQFVLLPQYSLGPDGRHELESVIHHLEEENRQLLHELELTHHEPRSGGSFSGSDGSEREWLREERDRMEAKQEILETHNRQLELQLQRLRLLLKQDSSKGSVTRSPLAPLSPNVPAQQVEPRKPLSPSVPAVQTEPSKSVVRHPPPAYTPHPTDSLHASPPYRLSSTNQVAGFSPINGPIRGSGDGEHEGYSHPGRQGPLAKQLFTSTPDCDNMRQLGVDTTYGTLEGTLAQTHYTLPAASQSQNFPDEEAELDEMIDRLDMAYPADESHTLLDRSESTMDEMYEAANRIGVAFSEFLSCDKPAGISQDSEEQEETVQPCEGPTQEPVRPSQHVPQLQESSTESPAQPVPTVGLEISGSTSEA